MAGAKKSSLRLLTEDSSSQRQRIVEHVCRDGQDQPRDRCQDTKPSPPRLNRDSKECAESPSEQRVSPQPEQRVSAAELPISAPIAEETAKAMGVLLIFWLLRPEFDNMRDGIVYGALVGIGFNWYEAALYVAQGYAESGVPPYGLQLGGRYALFGLGGHAMSTGIFGAFLGIAIQTHRRWIRILAPIAGLVLAIAAHMVNNALPLLAALAAISAGEPPAVSDPPDTGFLDAFVSSSLLELTI